MIIKKIEENPPSSPLFGYMDGFNVSLPLEKRRKNNFLRCT